LIEGTVDMCAAMALERRGDPIFTNTLAHPASIHPELNVGFIGFRHTPTLLDNVGFAKEQIAYTAPLARRMIKIVVKLFYAGRNKKRYLRRWLLKVDHAVERAISWGGYRWNGGRLTEEGLRDFISKEEEYHRIGRQYIVRLWPGDGATRDSVVKNIHDRFCKPILKGEVPFGRVGIGVDEPEAKKQKV
jgi:hypothetical protein